ncbi:DUF3795 domain-containing protein [Thermodesulfobacteriota bacterium]
MNTDNKGEEPVKKEAAVCGIFCNSCSIYIGTKEDPERLEEIAKNFNAPVEELECEGCRSDKRLGYCDNCVMFKCAAEKGIDFCGECEEYPCEELKQFQSILPHRIELWKSLERIRETGWEKWYIEMLDHYGCPECGVINSAYDASCRKCGNMPSCKYVEVNREEIAKRVEDLSMNNPPEADK